MDASDNLSKKTKGNILLSADHYSNTTMLLYWQRQRDMEIYGS